MYQLQLHEANASILGRRAACLGRHLIPPGADSETLSLRFGAGQNATVVGPRCEEDCTPCPNPVAAWLRELKLSVDVRFQGMLLCQVQSGQGFGLRVFCREFAEGGPCHISY